MKDKHLSCSIYKESSLSLLKHKKKVGVAVAHTTADSSSSRYAWLSRKQAKEMRAWLTKFLANTR